MIGINLVKLSSLVSGGGSALKYPENKIIDKSIMKAID